MNETSEQQGQSQGSGEDDLDLSAIKGPRLSSRRSPIISAVVVAIGAYLLISMFPGVRYWARGDTPRDLGEASALVSSGGLQEDLGEQYVVLEGTPDARTAAKAVVEDRKLQVLRVVEGGGSLFAAVPYSPDMGSAQFPGRFEGRMRRLSSTRMLEWIERYYADLGVTTSHELELGEGLGQGFTNGQVKTTSGALVPIASDDRVNLSPEVPDVRLQLGRQSFKRRAQARAAVEALGFPFYEPETQDNAKFYQFWARIPADQRGAARDKLNAGLELPSAPKATHGAAVLPGSATFTVQASELRFDGAKLTFPRSAGMPQAMFAVDGASLVPTGGANVVELPLSELRSAQLDKPLVVNPNGYIIQGGEKPSSHRIDMLLWLAALLIVGLNVASLVLYWRRRTA